MPVGVLVDPKAEVAHEYYAAVLWDGRAKRPMMLFSDMGGIDIEQVALEHPDHVGRGHLSNLHPVADFEAKQAVARCGMTGSELNRATAVLARLARLQRDFDMTLAEINPLARLADGSFVALDAHMEMEDEAVGRHRKLLSEIGVDLDEPRELYEPSAFERNVKAIDAADHRGVIQGKDHGFSGNLGLVIGAGGGSLTLTDAVRCQGGKPANYAEIGGNPSVAKSKGLAMEVLNKDGVEKIAVMMSIVSNTRVDIVARGVIKACLELGKDPAETIAVFRIPGAWEEEGAKILSKYGVEFRDRNTSMWEAAGEAVAKIQGDAGGAALSILLNEDFTFIVQGITGREAVNLTRECLDYGSKIVGGVTPGRKGRDVHGVPVFDTVEQVVEHHGSAPDGAVVTVPPAFTKDAVLEAIENGIKLIVVVTERIPRRDVAQMVELANERGARIIGPNCLGVIAPGVAKMGGIGGPAKDAAQGLRPRPGRRHVALGRHDHRDLLLAHGRRPRRLDRRLDRRRRDHRLHLRRADAAVRGRRADRGDRDLHRARRADGGRAGRLARGQRLAAADRRLHGREVHGRRGDAGDELRPRRHDRRGQGGLGDREDRPPGGRRDPGRRADRRDPGRVKEALA